MTCEQWVMLPTVTCNGYTLCDVVQMYPCQRYICDVCFEQLYRTKGTTVTCDGTPLQYPPRQAGCPVASSDWEPAHTGGW